MIFEKSYIIHRLVECKWGDRQRYCLGFFAKLVLPKSKVNEIRRAALEELVLEEDGMEGRS